MIREAGVSRTGFYRLWPQREQFIGDLIVELAKDAIPVENIRGEEVTAQIKELLLPRTGELRDQDSRMRVVTDLLPQASIPDFAYMSSQTASWRSYFGLTALVMNLPAGGAQAAAREGVALSESRYRDRLARNYDVLMRFLGVRLRAGSDASLEEVADLVIALVRGLVLRSRVAEPEPSESIFLLGVSAVFTHFFENDPDVTWDDKRIAELMAMLAKERDLFTVA
ncbi:hypothetical protein [Microbacterium sp.]|uniref:hypothetical protein n=1 Tax=Microbacterium sp. TaxID=51671 RepID=UPI003C709909